MNGSNIPNMTITVQPLNDLLTASAATADFKESVRALECGGNHPQVRVGAGVPRVKALRVIQKLLEAEPALAIRTASVEGSSGCSDFVGTLTVNEGETRFEFAWDCRWRAEQENMTTWYGQPDQQKAAQIFGYQCFERFERVD